jgi:hypothetical protein
MIATESYARRSFYDFGSGELDDGWFGVELEDEYDAFAPTPAGSLDYSPMIAIPKVV